MRDLLQCSSTDEGEIMSEAQEQEKRFGIRSNLQSVLDDYVKQCYVCEMSGQEIAEDVADVLYDASDKMILIEDVLVQ